MLLQAFARLRVRLLLLAFAGLLPALGLILSTAFEQRRLATADAQHEALRLARLGALEQSRRIDGARQLLIGLARSPEVLNEDRGACSARFSGILEQFPAYTNLAAATRDGAVFCSGIPLTTHVSLGDRSYLRRAVDTRGFAIGEYDFGRISGRPLLPIAYPAVDHAGSVRAVVVAALSLDWVTQFAAKASLPKDAAVTVWAPNRVILARYPDASSRVGNTVANAPLLRAIGAAHSEGVVDAAGVDGVPRLYAFTRLVTGPEPGHAYLAVGIPAAAVYAGANRILIRHLIALGVVSVIAFAVAWIAADPLVLRRVRTLVSTVRRLEAGDLSTRTGPPYGQSELDDLARGVDRMAAQLEARVGQLRESEARYRTLVEHFLVGVYVGGDDRILYVNQALADIFGYRPDEIVGRLRLIDLVHPDDRGLLRENVRARLRGDVDALRYTFHGLRKDGTMIHCEVFGRRISYEGQPAVMGTLIDMTERLRGETELRRLNRALRMLSECNLALVRSTDESELLNAICRVVVDLGGFRFAWVGFADHDEQKTVRPIARAGDEDGYLPLVNVSWADDEPGQSAVGSAIRSGRPSIVNDVSSVPAATRWRDEALRRGYASVIALPLLDGGQPFGALAIYAGERDAFRVEEVSLLTELSRDLAYGLLALRTRADRQRMEDEIEQQREARYQSDKLAALGQLLAGVAHELNNPLAVVTGRAALLRHKLEGQPLRRDADQIEEAAHRCARIVRNFLALARHQPPERQNVQLNQVVRDGVELLAYHLRLDDVEVEWDLADALPDIWGDPHQLHQVVVNLVTNAHHAMRQTPAPRRLTLTTRYRPAPGRVRLDVADTGPGIPPEVQARIFEPFFTTKPLGEGTGLGLSLCRGIVEDHVGTIHVDSRPGHGATFQIELPVGSASASPTDRPEAEPASPPIAKSILVVDDEPELAAMLAEVLTADGHRVETAANGVVALAKLAAGTYDLILSDLRMPEMDGPTLYGELEQRFPQLVRRTIFFTGDSLSREMWEFLERTGAPRVSKPFDFAALRRAVERSVEDRPTARP